MHLVGVISVASLSAAAKVTNLLFDCCGANTATDVVGCKAAKTLQTALTHIVPQGPGSMSAQRDPCRWGARLVATSRQRTRWLFCESLFGSAVI
eukprot:1258979-Amphidinium_carterae.1